jgi:predicted secreted Zn-dependent protease
MSRNPFVTNCLNKHPHVSSATACMMESAWDAAIATVLLQKDAKGKISVGKVKALKSTNQRQTGPDVPTDPSRTPTTDMTIAELDAALANASDAQRSEFNAEARRNGGMIPAIKLIRAWFGCSLKSGVDFVRAYPGSPRPHRLTSREIPSASIHFVKGDKR